MENFDTLPFYWDSGHFLPTLQCSLRNLWDFRDCKVHSIFVKYFQTHLTLFFDKTAVATRALAAGDWYEVVHTHS